MSFDYDLFVIGGGSGGVRAARVAAGETGAKITLSTTCDRPAPLDGDAARALMR